MKGLWLQLVEFCETLECFCGFFVFFSLLLVWEPHSATVLRDHFLWGSNYKMLRIQPG